MEEKFCKYLKDIKVPTPLQNKIEEMINYFESILTEKLENIFLCNTLNEDGTYDYTSLWLFFEDSVCEAKNILKVIDYDYMSTSQTQFKYWNIKSDIDNQFKDFTEKSRINLHIDFVNGLLWELYSCGNNCKYLYDLFTNYILKNFQKQNNKKGV